VKSKIPSFDETGTWKHQPAPEGHDRFICQGCGCEVWRPWPSRPFDDPDLPGSPWDDDRRCLNCWYGKPRKEKTTPFFTEQAEALDGIDDYKRLKQAAGAPKRGGMQWLADRGLAKFDEVRGVWLFRKVPLTDEKWVVAKVPPSKLMVRVRKGGE